MVIIRDNVKILVNLGLRTIVDPLIKVDEQIKAGVDINNVETHKIKDEECKIGGDEGSGYSLTKNKDLCLK